METPRTVPEIIDYLIMNSIDITKLVVAFETKENNFYVNDNQEDIVITLGMLEYAKEATLRGNDADDSKNVDEQTE